MCANEYKRERARRGGVPPGAWKDRRRSVDRRRAGAERVRTVALVGVRRAPGVRRNEMPLHGPFAGRRRHGVERGQRQRVEVELDLLHRLLLWYGESGVSDRY